MRAIIVADSGAVLASLTQLVAGLDRIELVRHASGRTNVEPQMRGFAPEIVLIDDMGLASRALARVREVRRAAPDAAIVVMAERIESAWLGQALRLGAAAVMPASADPATFRTVIAEVLEPTARNVIDFPRSVPARRAALALEALSEGSAA
jgi:DNA-binding NarL/FixJ family response regulator